MKTIFTCGCFDILHAGHVLLLEKARSLGDMLIVGINTDSSVAALKGDSRPINRLKDRIAVLRAIRFVDAVVPFHDLTPENLCRGIRPDIIVKGHGYHFDNCPEARLAAEWGGQLVIVQGPELSTTKTLEKLNA